MVWKNSRYELNVFNTRKWCLFWKTWILQRFETKSDSDYESSFFLYKPLKMKNLGDMNDLYNPQDVILLCKIAENRFQFMHDQYGFNPRKCNSASTLSSCIEREMLRVIIETSNLKWSSWYLWTNNNRRL